MTTVQDLRPVDDGIGGHVAGMLKNGVMVDVLVNDAGDGFSMSALIGRQVVNVDGPLKAQDVDALIGKAEAGKPFS